MNTINNPFDEEFDIEMPKEEPYGIDNEVLNYAPLDDRENDETQSFDPEEILRDLRNNARDLRFYSSVIVAKLNQYYLIEDNLNVTINRTKRFAQEIEDAAERQKSNFDKLFTLHHNRLSQTKFEPAPHFENRIKSHVDQVVDSCRQIRAAATEVTGVNNNFIDFFKSRKWWFYVGLSLPVILSLILSFSAIFWFRSAVQSRQEMREELQKDMAAHGKEVYERSYVEKLEYNTNVIQAWMKQGGTGVSGFEKFKQGYDSRGLEK